RRRAQAHRLRHPAGAQRRRPRLWAGQPRVRHAGALPAGGGRPHLRACYGKPVMAALDDLLDAVFGAERPAREDAFFEEFAGWARDSRRFRDFATEYSTKIRAKLRRAGDEEALADVRAELETAALLLGDRRFTLEYEKYAASRQRGPDFTVTFRTHTPFNVEVRRIRSLELGDDYGGKLMTVLSDKVGQTQPGMPNLLWLIAGPPVTLEGLEEPAAALRALAERKEEAYFTR